MWESKILIIEHGAVYGPLRHYSPLTHEVLYNPVELGFLISEAPWSTWAAAGRRECGEVEWAAENSWKLVGKMNVSEDGRGTGQALKDGVRQRWPESSLAGTQGSKVLCSARGRILPELDLDPSDGVPSYFNLEENDWIVWQRRPEGKAVCVLQVKKVVEADRFDPVESGHDARHKKCSWNNQHSPAQPRTELKDVPNEQQAEGDYAGGARHEHHAIAAKGRKVTGRGWFGLLAWEQVLALLALGALCTFVSMAQHPKENKPRILKLHH
jgi:hypothetical protein